MPAEAISANAYTVGTASGIVVGMSAVAQNDSKLGVLRQD